MNKNVAIINFNTPEMTEAAILSVRKHGGENYNIFVFDNSDERPFKKRMKGVKTFNNTKGKIIDFKKWLDEFPDKEPEHAAINDWGSARHIRTVQELWKLIPDGFLLMESDVLLTDSVDFMFNEKECAVGHVMKYGDKMPERMLPLLCWINVPMCVAGGATYYDPNRCWMLQKGLDTPGNWYDTGAAFLEDIITLKPQCHGLAIDIRPLMVHYNSASWLNNDLEKQKQWLEAHGNLWK